MSAIVSFETLPELFAALIENARGSNRTALKYKDRRSKQWVEISWEALERDYQSFAGFLSSRGCRQGVRIALLSENRPEWAVADMALQSLGAINVSLYTSLPASQVSYILKDSGATIFIVSTSVQLKKAKEVFDDCPELTTIVAMHEFRSEQPDYVVHWDDAMREGASYWHEHSPVLSKIGPSVKPDDIASLIYTSGTTGNPKGVMLTHANFCSNATAALSKVPFGPGDEHLSFLPLCHSFERTAGYLCVLAAGGQISYAEGIDTVNRNLLELSPTVMISVPRLFERVFNVIHKTTREASPLKRRVFEWSVSSGTRFAKARKNAGGPGPILRIQNALAQRMVFSRLHEKLGGKLRFAVSGGAALPRAVGEFFEAAGILLIEGYGLTETSPVLSINPLEEPRYGTVGYVLPGVTIGIVRLLDGELVGELAGNSTGSTLTSEEGEIVAKGPNIMKGYWNNEDATREAIDEDGWYHTGDVGRFVNGYLQITDRIKHMIVSKGGKNIYPGPIEDRLKTNPWIDQLLVVGEGREFLTALVVPDLDALSAHARENNIAFASTEQLLASDAIRAVFEKEFRAYSRAAASPEKIRDFRLIVEPFTVENLMMTPTLKPRRRVIEKEYADVIEDMYKEVI